MNEVYEYIRLLFYPIGAYAFISLGQVIVKARWALFAAAAYFLMWAALLVVQAINPHEYREIANHISTPALGLIIVIVYLNIYSVRRD